MIDPLNVSTGLSSGPKRSDDLWFLCGPKRLDDSFVVSLECHIFEIVEGQIISSRGKSQDSMYDMSYADALQRQNLGHKVEHVRF